MVPEGLEPLERWHAPGSAHGWAVIEGSDTTAIAQHMAEWGGHLRLEITPVIEDAEAAAALSKVYGWESQIRPSGLAPENLGRTRAGRATDWLEAASPRSRGSCRRLHRRPRRGSPGGGRARRRGLQNLRGGGSDHFEKGRDDTCAEGAGLLGLGLAVVDEDTVRKLWRPEALGGPFSGARAESE
jgi:hypothetical protein